MRRVLVIEGEVKAGGSATLLAQLELWDGTLAEQADVSTISVRITDHETGNVVPGWNAVSYAKADVIIDAPDADDPRWQRDDGTGPNFALLIDGSGEQPAFPTAGQTYDVLVTITPTVGPPIYLDARLPAV